QLDPPRAAVIGVLDTGHQALLDEVVDRSAHRRGRGAQFLGQLLELAAGHDLAEAADLEDRLALGQREAGLPPHLQLVAAVPEEEVAHQGDHARRGLALLRGGLVGVFLDDRLGGWGSLHVGNYCTSATISQKKSLRAWWISPRGVGSMRPR